MSKIRTIFMGTPVFACAILEQLLKEEEIELIAVISQPDRKVGRKQLLTNTPVKQLALQHNIPVYQMEKLAKDYQAIIQAQPDLIITCAYGQLVPEAILTLPSLGCINVHASLLPALRGGAPIHKAIINGDEKTGITIMEMAKKMDAGAIISQKAVTITAEMHRDELENELMNVGCSLLHDTLPAIIHHSYTPIPQDEQLVTYAFNISKEEEKIDFSQSYQSVFNQIRGLSPNPGAYCLANNLVLKLYHVCVCNESTDKENGYVLGFRNNCLAIAIDKRVLLVDELQPSGKGRMKAKDFQNGLGKNLVGTILK